MKKSVRGILFTAVLLFALPVGAQETWKTVVKKGDVYLCGYGEGVTVDEAKRVALNDLITQITVVVIGDMESTFDEVAVNDQAENHTYVQNKIRTLSVATLNNTCQEILHNEPDAKVGIWIKRSEVARIFTQRKNAVAEYMDLAQEAEAKGKVDNALRYYYWAFSLLKTIPHNRDVMCTEQKESAGKTTEVKHVAVQWIPNKINDIFGDISVKMKNRDGDRITLSFDFRERPVTSLDYTYWDGRAWSAIYSAKDGVGVVELAPGAEMDNVQLKYEYAFMGEAHIDADVNLVMNTIRQGAWKKAYISVDCSKGKSSDTRLHFSKEEQKKPESKSKQMSADVARPVSATLTPVADEKPYRDVLNKVASAIRSGKYESALDCFSPDGADMYRKLVHYGNAKLLGDQDIRLVQFRDGVVARSMKMSFSFSRGVRKAFVEDIVFTFDSDKKIDCLAFGLGKDAQDDILKKRWPEEIKLAIVEFMENYKTAFALKRLDYLQSIFDDNAVIIVGHSAKSVPLSPQEVKLTVDKPVVRRTLMDKKTYMDRLARVFNSQEFVNIRFGNSDVSMTEAKISGGEWVGIQIKQDYYSTTYGDEGYLFLLVDINNPSKPCIKVRTWQPERDPIDGLIGIYSF